MSLHRLDASILRLSRPMLRAVRAYRDDRNGVAIVEFALLLPLMIIIWVGLVVATDSLTSARKVSLLARTLADMTTQSQTVTQTDMDAFFRATEAVMWPKPATRLGMRVNAYDIDSKGKVFVDWSVVPSNTNLRGNFTPLARCTPSDAVPSGLRIPGTSLVQAEVTMRYQASIATEIADQIFDTDNGEMPLSDTLFMRARQTSKVSFSPPPSKPCSGFNQ